MSEKRIHTYTDDNGKPVARKVIEKNSGGRKFCRWEGFSNGAWTKGTDGIAVPLYRADKIIALAVPNEVENALLFIVEGEKDTETMERFGFTATTTPTGVWKPEFDHYVNRDDVDVIIFSDNDTAGEERARKIFAAVKAVNPRVRWIKPTTLYSDCPPKGDISDIADILGDKHVEQAVWDAVTDPNCAENMGGKNNVAVTCLADVQPTSVRWLWYPYIAYGKITIIMGDPGTGKTTLSTAITAHITTGRELPQKEDYQAAPIQAVVDNLETVGGYGRPVILQNAEDGYGDTIRPRLSSAGADLNRVYFINEVAETPLSFTDSRLEEAIERYKPTAVIIDPVQAYLSANVDMYCANEICPIMARLAALAEKYDTAVILIGHMNKTGDKNALYRGLGSIDFVGAARSVLGVGVIDRADGCNFHRAIVQIKSNLAPKGSAVLFDLDPERGFVWGGFDENLTETEVMSYKAPKTWHSGGASESAKELILAEIASGNATSKHISEMAQQRNISSATLNRAKKELGIKSIKQGGEWIYSLPVPDSEDNQLDIAEIFG
jgi:hypothetical protein